MKKNDSGNTDHASQETIESLRKELRFVHEELNRTNSELMQLTVDLDRRVEERTEELRASEESLRHINRLLMSIRNINQAIVTEKDPRKLLEEVCEVLVEVTGYSFAVVGLLEENTGELVPAACWGLGGEKGNPGCMTTSGKSCETDCPAKAVVKKKESISIGNIGKITRHTAWKKNAMALGLKSFIAVPILHGNSAYGYLSVYSTQEDYFENETEIGLLEEVANDIGLALNNIKLEEERKRAEEALRESEKRLNEAQRIAKIGDFVWDVDTGAITWSDGLHSILGYDASEEIDYELVNKNIHHPEDRERVNQWLTECVSSGKNEVTPNEYRIIRKDGQVIDARTVGKIEHSEDGFARVFATVQDITERKRAEEALREGEERYRELFDNISSGVAVYEAVDNGEDFIFKDFNKAGERIEGLEKKDVLGMRLAERFPGVKEFGLFEVLQRVWRTGKQEFFPEAIYHDERDQGSWRESWVYKLPSGEIVAVYDDITERKQAEEALRESEKRLNEAQHIARIGSWSLDYSSGYTYSWSDETYRIFNQTPESFTPTFETISKLIHSDDNEKINKLFEEVIRERQDRFEYEYRIVNPDGSIRYTYAIGRAIYDKSGIPLEISGTVQDITERKRAEEALRESEEQYRLLADNTLDVIWTLNSDLDFQYINPAIYEMTGYTSEEWIGSNLADHTDEINFELMAKVAAGAIAEGPNGSGFAFEAEMIRKDGTPFSVEIRGKPIFSEQGDFVIMQGITRDITERKQAEEALRESEEQYRLLADNTLDVIWTVNSNFEFEYVNPVIYEMTGYTPEEWIGSSLADHLEEAQFQRLAKLPENLIKENQQAEGVTFVTKMFKKDGTIFDAEVHSKMIFDENGEFVHFQGITRDVTKRLVAERELAERERLLTFAIEQVPVPIIIATAPDVAITRYNEAAVDMLAVVPEDVSDIPLEEHRELWPTFHPDGTPYTIEDLPLTRAIQKGEVTRNEEIIVRQNERDRWISASAAPLYDENGEIVAGIVVFPEITDVKKAQEELHQQEILLRNIIDTSPALIFVKDREGRYVLVNDAIAEVYGQAPEDMLGKTDRDFIDLTAAEETDLEKFIQDDREVIEKQQLKFIPEERFQKPNGTTFWFQTTKTPLSIKGESDYLLGVAIDITERKAAQEALEHSKRSYEAIYNASTDCIFVHDGQTGEIVDVNQTTAERFGYSKEELRRLPVGDLSLDEPPFTQKEAMGFIRKAVEEGPQHFEWLARKKNGELIWFENSLQYVTLAGEQRVLVVGRDITERKQAEEAVRKNEEKYRNLVENLNEGIWAIDPEGYTTFVNPSMARMLGYEVEEMMGVHLFDFMSEKWRDICRELMERRRSGMFEQHEFEFLKKDGETLYAYLSTSPMYDELGEYIGATATVTDVTEKRKAEEELRRSEEILKNVGRVAKVGGWELNVESKEVRWTEETYRIHEVSLDYKPSLEEAINFFHPDDRPRLETAIQRALDHGEPYDMELRFITASGKELWTHTICRPQVKDGRTIKLTGTFHDITDQKQYEEALRESEEKFRNFFETCKDVIYITDVYGRILDVNPAVKDLSGYERDEIIGQLNDLVYADFVDLERFKELISRQGFVKDFEVTYKDKEGMNHFCLETATVRRDASGNIVGYQGFIRDNTERVKMQEQLIQAEKLSSLGGILSGVAHELNNPLTAIIGNAQLLSRMDITTEIKKKLDTIYRESFRCTKIVGGLLSFAREHKPERIMTDINQVIMEAYKLREYELRVDDVSLRTDLDAKIPEIYVDPYQIQQVLINLINNAYHALRDTGGGTVMIKSRCEKNSIVIECIDDGPGIPDEIKRKIFDPFFTTKETGEGTGLGLSICYGIVTEHDGSIEVESHPGFGTRFIVSLPISEGVTVEDESASSKPISKPEGKVTVLVIEDEASLRNFVCDALEVEGYTAVSSESADRAVEILKDRHFNVIVSDMKMPGMSGQNFYTYVQKYHPQLAEKIVFMTGDVLGRETQGFFKITGCRYIEKPFEIDDLMIVLGELLQEEKKVH